MCVAGVGGVGGEDGVQNKTAWSTLDGREQLMMTAGSGHRMTGTTGKITSKILSPSSETCLLK